MQTSKCNFIPVFLGSDAGAYGMARSFHEEYGIRTICLDHMDLVFCRYSDMIDVVFAENLEDEDKFAGILIDFAKKFEGRTLLLMAFTDVYAELLIKNKELLDDYYVIPTIGSKMYDQLAYKHNFYRLCENLGLDIPKTVVCTYEDYLNGKIEDESIKKLGMPLVLKPSDSSLYWQTEFEGRKKAYKIKSIEDLHKTISKIYASSYHDELIVQEYIDGCDEENYILNCYSDKNGKVVYMCMGQILLEEKGPTGVGSPSAIIDYYDEKIIDKIKNFLEGIGFVGFSNFDFKYDKKNDKLVVFEINLRLGRSSYYANSNTYNLSRLVVDDYIFNKKTDFHINKDENLWCIIPIHILFEWIKSDALSERVYHLIRKKKIVNSLVYDKDMNERRRNLLNMKMLRYIEIYDFYRRNEEINNEIL